jgi:hypothetical protein
MGIEYRGIEYDRTTRPLGSETETDAVARILNAEAAKGWELETITYSADNKSTFIWLKRRTSNLPTTRAPAQEAFSTKGTSAATR